ncbi:MAG TPA: fluoride efflux transporter CrcB [Nostocaceae cyanobacterium]|nr:fluoride efflux transporter CrcB [Nostocaceae cyanobacterium]
MIVDYSSHFLTLTSKLLGGVIHNTSIRAPLAISLGAIAGALCRYYLTLWFIQRFGLNFPVGTFFINLTGCLAMGFFTTLAVEKVRIISPDIKLMITTGFLGAYTTFSTYGLDTINLLHRGAWLSATGYWLGSAILGIIGVQIGMICARLL